MFCVSRIPLIVHTAAANVDCPGNSSSSTSPNGSLACVCDQNYNGSITWDFDAGQWAGACNELGCPVLLTADPLSVGMGDCSEDGLQSGEACTMECKVPGSYKDISVACYMGALTPDTASCTPGMGLVNGVL